VAGPFERHLRDAIVLNRKRAAHYAERSRGRSRSVSRTLITIERALLPVARWFDRRAAPYHDAGIPFLDEAFLSMEQAPALDSARRRATSVTYHPPHAAEIRRRIRNAFQSGGFAAAANALAAELRALDGDPHLDCAVRHLLESAHRVALLAPIHASRALSLGLPSPEPISAKLLRLHLWGLRFAARLDARARPLQLEGVAILEQDLPRAGG
jgi:hypothetical protein